MSVGRVEGKSWSVHVENRGGEREGGKKKHVESYEVEEEVHKKRCWVKVKRQMYIELLIVARAWRWWRFMRETSGVVWCKMLVGIDGEVVRGERWRLRGRGGGE